MDPERIAQLRNRAVSAWHKILLWATPVPGRAWIVLGFFFVAALLLALLTAFSTNDSSLHLKVQHSFRSAEISVWVDGDLAYSGHLVGSSRKKFGLIPDTVQGTLSRIVPVPSGQHKIRVRVDPEDGSAQEEIGAGSFPHNGERDLVVSARRGDLTLSWPGTGDLPATTASEEPASPPGWVSRYAGSLFLTIAGSIISAITGYAIRELPAQLRARQDVTPKS
jgi:hypothetical protein